MHTVPHQCFFPQPWKTAVNNKLAWYTETWVFPKYFFVKKQKKVGIRVSHGLVLLFKCVYGVCDRQDEMNNMSEYPQ